MLKKLLLTAALVAVGSGVATAHTSLETEEAPVGASYKAVFRVPHGCEGKPTNVVRVQIPEGVICRQADAEARLDPGEGKRRLREILRQPRQPDDGRREGSDVEGRQSGR